MQHCSLFGPWKVCVIGPLFLLAFLGSFSGKATPWPGMTDCRLSVPQCPFLLLSLYCLSRCAHGIPSFPCTWGDHVNTSWPLRCRGGGVRMPLRLCPQREGDTRPLPSWNMEEVVSCRGLWEEATSGGWWYNQRVSAWFFHDLSEQGDCSLLRCCVRDINFHVVQATAIWPPRFSSQTCTLSDAPGTHSSLHSGPRPSFLHWFLRKCHMPDHWAEQNCFLYPEYLYFFQFSIHSLSFGKHPPLSSHVAQGQECDLGLADQPILPLTTCPGQLVQGWEWT